jgi:hypothetical protein
MSRAGYARHRGCSLYSVQVAIKAGRISLTEDDRIDSDAADKEWAARTTPGPKRGPKKGTDGEAVPADFAKHRAEREKAQAGLAKLKLQERKRQLIPTERAMQAWGGVIQRCRARLLAIPNRAAPLMLGVKTLAEGQTILQELIHEALSELANPDLADGR